MPEKDPGRFPEIPQDIIELLAALRKDTADHPEDIVW